MVETTTSSTVPCSPEIARSVRRRRRNRWTGLVPSPVLVVAFLAWLNCANALSGIARSASPTKPTISACDDETALLPPSVVVRIPEGIWREAASDHRERIGTLLKPGLVGWDHPMMASISASRKRKLRNKTKAQKRSNPNGIAAGDDATGPEESDYDENSETTLTMLDHKHPVYNFLVEYYGLKGLKGPKRLARWSPGVGVFFLGEEDSVSDSRTTTTPGSSTMSVRTIRSVNDYYKASELIAVAGEASLSHYIEDRGVFLEGATPDDFGGILHLKDAQWIDPSDADSHEYYGSQQGVLYRPRRTQRRDPTGLLWYRSVLDTTLANEPILYCYGLHEWAMQYHPEGAPPPPSGKYQAHLPLRVSRETINETVERRGVSCTHVDALRFFAPAAAPLNHHGATLARTDQLSLEQPACVHAHMDLLKIALKLTPYCDPSLLVDVLEVALEARTLDVGASPYDPKAYECPARTIPIIPVETPSGRALYKKRQAALMEAARPIRSRLRDNLSAVLRLLHSDDQLERGESNPSDERFATATPGGKPWRKSLTDRPVGARH